MELKKGDVNVYLNDQLANHYVMDSTINIPKKDTFYVPLNLKISPKLLISSAHPNADERQYDQSAAGRQYSCKTRRCKF